MPKDERQMKTQIEMQTGILINILLAFLWVAVTGAFTVSNFLFGFVASLVVMWVIRPLAGSVYYGRRAWYLSELLVFFIWELLLSSLRVSRDILLPMRRLESGVVALPLDVESDAEITVLANLISLTPGTLSLDLSDDKKTLFVHFMNIERRDVEGARRDVKERLERRVRRAIGPAVPHVR